MMEPDRHNAGLRPDRLWPAAGQAGLTLLEVIVALAILGICVSVLLRIFAGSAGAARITDDYLNALSIAETRMALLTAEESPQGTDTGSVDGYRWQTRVVEYQPERDNPLFWNADLIDLENDYVTYHFLVSVRWGARQKRTLELSTLRLGARP